MVEFEDVLLPEEGIQYREKFISNSRGLKLFTCQWQLLPEPKALVFLCHGYAMECSVSMKGTALRLAKAGYAVHGIDYEGHGKSGGMQGFVPSFVDLVADCAEHFTKISEMKENKKKRRFLLGESMGGAVALLIHRKQPAFWDGGVLVAPMCKIADDMKPHPFVSGVLTKLCKLVPTWRIVPTKDIIDSAVKRQDWRDKIRDNPYCYKGKPRLKTAHELLMASLDAENNLDKVSFPFIIVHGGDDKVTDPSVSRALYETAASHDKTLKLYPGMWHALTSGEPEENIDIVFSDIVAWLDKRSPAPETFEPTVSEVDMKMENDNAIHKLCGK